MPYEIRGKCIYRKDTGKKVGCTDGDVHKYMAALQMHAHESEEKTISEIRILVRKELSDIHEAKKKKEDKEIHLPELTMKKNELIKYLKELYGIELK